MDKQPIEQSALLVIDAQDSFKRGPRWERRSNPHFEANVNTLIQAWRAAALPVIFVIHHDDSPGFRPGDPDARLMSFIERHESEPLLFKNTRNSFTSTDLQQRLEILGVGRLVITGIQTEQCCETTARLAADLGYDVDFVTEATMSFPILNQENGEELATDEIIHRTEFVLRGRFARIVRVADLTAELEGALTSVAR
jgi:nicotinamidase-related amidase